MRHLTVNKLGEGSRLGVVLLKAFQDELGMVDVSGKNNRFADTVTVFDLDGVGHEVVQHTINGIYIEEPFVQGLCIDGAR